MRHKHADLIHAYAEGAEIEYLYDNEWRTIKNPRWSNTIEYRIKPKEPEWYENIPEHGVLCWVSGHIKEPNNESQLRRIYTRNKHTLFIEDDGQDWRYATPLTDNEIKQFLRDVK